MKSLILNEIYSASLLYYLFLSYYIFKYVVIIDGEWGGYGERPSDRESPSRTLFYLCEDGDGFEGGDGNGKTIPYPGPHYPAPLPSLALTNMKENEELLKQVEAAEATQVEELARLRDENGKLEGELRGHHEKLEPLANNNAVLTGKVVTLKARA